MRAVTTKKSRAIPGTNAASIAVPKDSAGALLQTAAEGLRCGNAKQVQQALHNLYVLSGHQFPFRNDDTIASTASTLGIELMKKLFAPSCTTYRYPFQELAFPAIDAVVELCDLSGVLPSKNMATLFTRKLYELRCKLEHESSVKLDFFYRNRCIDVNF